MKFSKEPIVYVTLAIVVLQLVAGLLTHHIDVTLWTSLSSAAAAVLMRQNVYSKHTVETELTHDISGPQEGEDGELYDKKLVAELEGLVND